MKHTFEFRVVQEGMTVAQVSARCQADAEHGIALYAAQYASEGPLTVEEKVSGKWKPIAEVDGCK